ncbi:MAG TPA: glycosyltransferase family 4 protein [Bryobacteraceae bacterium]
MTKSASLFLLAPQMYGSWGGVQTYMRRLREILCSYANLHESNCLSISLVDESEQAELHARPVRQSFRCCSGSKFAFVRESLVAAWANRGGFAVVGHLGLAPIALLLRQAGLIRGYMLILHGMEAWERVSWLKREAAFHADAIVATTQFTGREFARSNDLPQDRLRVIALALEDNEAEPVKPAKSSGDFVLLAVSRLSTPDQYKGIDTVIRAVGLLRRDALPVTLRIVGSGDDQLRLRRIAHELGVEDRVEFLGSVEQHGLAKQYAECDVFTLPSSKEGFGIVFLEAMRHGKPCIGARHGGIPEVIGDGVDGYLVDYGDAVQVAARVRELWKHPEQTEAMGLAARRKIAGRYCFHRMQNEWFHLLDEALAQHFPARAAARISKSCAE